MNSLLPPITQPTIQWPFRTVDEAAMASRASRPLPTAFEPANQPRSLFYTHSVKGGVLVIRPTGPNIGQREAAILNSEVRPMIDQLGARLRTLVIDLSDVQAMASFGLGMCIELRNAAHGLNARTIVFGLNDELSSMFRLMKVDRLYTMVKSAADLARALAA